MVIESLINCQWPKDKNLADIASLDSLRLRFLQRISFFRKQYQRQYKGNIFMKKKLKVTEDVLRQKATLLEQVLTFRIVTTIKKNFSTLDNFKKVAERIHNNSSSKEELVKFNNTLHVDYDRVIEILGQKRVYVGNSRKRLFELVLQYIDPSVITFQKNINRHFSSGKRFSVSSRWFIPFKRLDWLFSLDGTEKSPFNTKNIFYTKEEHRKIDDVIIYRKKEDEEMKENENVFINDIAQKVARKNKRAKIKSRATRLANSKMKDIEAVENDSNDIAVENEPSEKKYENDPNADIPEDAKIFGRYEIKILLQRIVREGKMNKDEAVYIGKWFFQGGYNRQKLTYSGELGEIYDTQLDNCLNYNNMLDWRKSDEGKFKKAQIYFFFFKKASENLLVTAFYNAKDDEKFDLAKTRSSFIDDMYSHYWSLLRNLALA